MWRVLLGLLLGLSLNLPWAWALRIEQPQTIYEWNTNTFSQLNQILLMLWNISNGRYQNNASTSDPDGTVLGAKWEQLVYDNGASEELCINVDGAKDWDCVALTP